MKWTPEQEQQLRELYATDMPVRIIAHRIGRSTNSVYCKAYTLGLSDTARQGQTYKRDSEQLCQQAYRHGMDHRSKGRQKSPPSRYAGAERAWWLAGWHDRDMELEALEVAA